MLNLRRVVACCIVQLHIVKHLLHDSLLMAGMAFQLDGLHWYIIIRRHAEYIVGFAS